MSDYSRQPSDISLQVRIFAGVGAFFGVIAVVYWFWSYEDAGTAMLVLATGLAGMCAFWLWAQERKLRRSGPDDAAFPHAAAGEVEEYVPHASVWPLGIGVAAFVITNGLILSNWFVLPGVVLLALSVVGFARQSRYRD